MSRSDLEAAHEIVARMKAEAALCIKCQENPRSGKGRWCRGCRAAYMREWRRQKREAVSRATEE